MESNIIKIEKVSKETDLIEYSTDIDLSCCISVLKNNKVIYQDYLNLEKETLYWTSLSDVFSSKTVQFSNEVFTQTFYIPGKDLRYVDDFKSIELRQPKTELCYFFDRYNSDKSGSHKNKSNHNYSKFYFELLNDRRYDNLNIFELGLGTNDINIESNMGYEGNPGASLYAWRDFLPNSKIYGADIDYKILFDSDRIKTFFCDQTNSKTIQLLWENKYLSDIYFDLIVDDGLHDFYGTLLFLESSLNKIKPGGQYIIEDVHNKYFESWIFKFKELRKKFPNFTFDLIQIDNEKNYWDNNIIFIEKKH